MRALRAWKSDVIALRHDVELCVAVGRGSQTSTVCEYVHALDCYMVPCRFDWESLQHAWKRKQATSQGWQRQVAASSMKSLPQVFFGPGLRGKLFGGEKFRKRWKAGKKYFLVRGYGARFLAGTNCASDEKLAKSIFWYFFYENPNPGATFFVYVKLLISLLSGALFRLGENFSVRGYGAKFWAGDFQQLFKAYGKNPLRHLLRSRFGEKHVFFVDIFLSHPHPYLLVWSSHGLLLLV